MALSLSLALLLRRRPFLARGFLSAAGFGELRLWQILSDLLRSPTLGQAWWAKRGSHVACPAHVQKTLRFTRSNYLDVLGTGTVHISSLCKVGFCKCTLMRHPAPTLF